MMSTPWTPEQVASLKQMKAYGKSNAEIAERTGRTIWAVRAKLDQLAMTPEQRLAFNARRNTRQRRTRGSTDRYVDFVQAKPVDQVEAERRLDERDRRWLAPIRDTTAYFCGDPRVGYSALEARR